MGESIHETLIGKSQEMQVSTQICFCDTRLSYGMKQENTQSETKVDTILFRVRFFWESKLWVRYTSLRTRSTFSVTNLRYSRINILTHNIVNVISAL